MQTLCGRDAYRLCPKSRLLLWHQVTHIQLIDLGCHNEIILCQTTQGVCRQVGIHCVVPLQVQICVSGGSICTHRCSQCSMFTYVHSVYPCTTNTISTHHPHTITTPSPYTQTHLGGAPAVPPPPQYVQTTPAPQQNYAQSTGI